MCTRDYHYNALEAGVKWIVSISLQILFMCHQFINEFSRNILNFGDIQHFFVFALNLWHFMFGCIFICDVICWSAILTQFAFSMLSCLLSFCFIAKYKTSIRNLEIKQLIRYTIQSIDSPTIHLAFISLYFISKWKFI